GEPDIKIVKSKTSLETVRSYALASDRLFMAYLVNGNPEDKIVSTTVLINSTVAGRAYWIDPKTGNVVSSRVVPKGDQVLEVPKFSEDIGLIIKEEKG
ncbi:hypothetical protein HZC07_00545, partial [Candidatus Micrarchaeota archaeon]|nr:hypothetical protein [Candidatus Micrarchaeota archaeon]